MLTSTPVVISAYVSAIANFIFLVFNIWISIKRDSDTRSHDITKLEKDYHHKEKLTLLESHFKTKKEIFEKSVSDAEETKDRPVQMFDFEEDRPLTKIHKNNLIALKANLLKIGMHYGTNIYKAYLEFIETFDDHWNIISSEAQKTTIATKQAIVKLQHTQESDIASRNSLYGSENVDYLDLKIMSQYADLDALDEKYFEQSQNLYTLIQEAVAHIDPSYINLLVFFREELGVNQAIKTANAAHAQW